jgi:hypothetical protein
VRGEAGQEMFVIEKGLVRISKTMPGIGEEAFAILETRQYSGARAVIEDSLRWADAIAHLTCAV